MRALQLEAAAVGLPTQIVRVGDGESIEVGVTITETTGRPIGGASVGITVGSPGFPPSQFGTPDIDRPSETLNVRTISRIVDSATPPGRYSRWVKISDGDEIRILRAPGVVIVR